MGQLTLQPAMQPEKHFLHRLESLRGLAALCVAIHHSLFMIVAIGLAGTINRGLLSVFYGRGAVICFFVLSGLVLGESLKRNRQNVIPGCLHFYTRRFLRIYPPFIVCLLICTMILLAFNFWKMDSLAASQSYSTKYVDRTSLNNVFKNLCLFEYDLNPVTWSLAVEMIGSFLLPLFHLMSGTVVSRGALFVCLFLFQFLDSATRVFGDLPIYLWMFYLGYLIPLFPACLLKFLGRQRIALLVLLSAAVLVFASTSHFGNHTIPCSIALGFMILAIFHFPNERVFSFLDHNTLRFYGRISYSFYLFHWPIVYSFAGLMFWAVPYKVLINGPIVFSIALAFLSIVLATVVAMFSYNYVEKPCISWGKRLRHRKDPGSLTGEPPGERQSPKVS